MASAEVLEKELVDAQSAVTIQGDTVRSLKASLKDKKAEKVVPRLGEHLLHCKEHYTHGGRRTNMG
jgi:hypothetical protein